MTIIKKITEIEISELQSSIADSESLWGPHSLHTGVALCQDKDRAGETIWLHTRDGSDWLNYNSEPIKKIHNVLEMYRDMVMPNSRFGRVYIHRLKPNKIVSRHRDVNDRDYFLVVKRYQVYFDIPEHCEIVTDSQILENSMVWFNHNEWHSYTNNSDKDLIFIVFDLLDQPVKKL